MSILLVGIRLLSFEEITSTWKAAILFLGTQRLSMRQISILSVNYKNTTTYTD
jgi:hypothetical protein